MAATSTSEEKCTKVVVQPSENPLAFVESIGKGPLKQVSYQVLDWVNTAIGKNEAPPGAAKQETSPKDFMSYLKDGVILAKLANVLQPNAINTVHEDTNDKNKQTDNISNFLNFAKRIAGVKEADTVIPEEVQAGKTSQFSGLLATLVSLGGKAAQQFSQQGLDLNSLVDIVQGFISKGFMAQVMSLKDRFFNKQPQPVVQPEVKKTVASPQIPHADE